MRAKPDRRRFWLNYGGLDCNWGLSAAGRGASLEIKAMAHALKIHTVVSGKTLTLSDLGAFEGKRVQVTVQEELEQDVEQVAPLLPRRELGLLRGKVWLADDFDAPLPDDIQKYFDGNAD